MQSLIHRPIPKLVTSYQEHIEIIDTNEPLVEFTNDTHARIFIRPMYFEQQLNGSVNAIYLREEAFKRVLKAVELLPDEYNLLLYDGYRPLSVQQHLFDNVKAITAKQHPHLTEQELHAYTLKYVAFPSTEKNATAPHLTGGAIDLTLSDTNGVPLHMGTEFDAVTPASATSYFEHYALDEVARLNRRILYHAMTDAGFANYEEEWWHYEYGNKSWAARTNHAQTKYAPIDLKFE